MLEAKEENVEHAPKTISPGINAIHKGFFSRSIYKEAMDLARHHLHDHLEEKSASIWSGKWLGKYPRLADFWWSWLGDRWRAMTDSERDNFLKNDTSKILKTSYYDGTNITIDNESNWYTPEIDEETGERKGGKKTVLYDVRQARAVRNSQLITYVSKQAEDNQKSRVAHIITALSVMDHEQTRLASDLKDLRILDLLLLTARDMVMSANVWLQNSGLSMPELVNDISGALPIPHASMNIFRRPARHYAISRQKERNKLEAAFAKERGAIGKALINDDYKLDQSQNEYLDQLGTHTKAELTIHDAIDKRYFIDKTRHKATVVAYSLVVSNAIMLAKNATEYSLLVTGASVKLLSLLNATLILVAPVILIGFYGWKYWQVMQELAAYYAARAAVNNMDAGLRTSLAEKGIISELKEITVKEKTITSTDSLEKSIIECQDRFGRIKKKAFFTFLLFLSVLPVLLGIVLAGALGSGGAFALAMTGVVGASLYLLYKIQKKYHWAGLFRALALTSSQTLLLGGVITLLALHPGSWAFAFAIIPAAFIMLPTVIAYLQATFCPPAPEYTAISDDDCENSQKNTKSASKIIAEFSEDTGSLVTVGLSVVVAALYFSGLLSGIITLPVVAATFVTLALVLTFKIYQNSDSIKAAVNGFFSKNSMYQGVEMASLSNGGLFTKTSKPSAPELENDQERCPLEIGHS